MKTPIIDIKKSTGASEIDDTAIVPGAADSTGTNDGTVGVSMQSGKAVEVELPPGSGGRPVVKDAGGGVKLSHGLAKIHAALEATGNNGDVDATLLAKNTAAVIGEVKKLPAEQKPAYVRDFAGIMTEVKKAYAGQLYDEHMRPIVVTDAAGNPRGRIQHGEPVFFFNYRTDRPRQLIHAMVDADFPSFERISPPLDNVGSMTPYDSTLVGKVKTVTTELVTISEPMDEIFERAGVSSYKVAESDKAPHVTKFLRGLRDDPYSNEVVRIIPSAKIQKTYAEAPAMAYAACVDAGLALADLKEGSVTQSTLAGVPTPSTDGTVANTKVNPASNHLTINLPIDQVGHSGDLEAAIESCEILDRELGRLVDGLLSRGYHVMITADHGNVEEMINPDGSPNTSHSTNKVPFIYCDPTLGAASKPRALRSGASLADVAPTLLAVRGMKQPEAMSGKSIVAGGAGGGAGAKKTAIVVLDGFGISPNPKDPGDATRLAKMPNLHRYEAIYGRTELDASSEKVGLRPGVQGNSEVGHMHIGAGRVVKQSLVKVDDLIDPKTGTFGPDAKAILELIRQAKRDDKPLHVMGLCSEGQVHSSLSHLYAILRTAKQEGLEKVYIHAFTDGRDTQRDSGQEWLAETQRMIAAVGVGEVVTVIGRFWAMDRNLSWERTFRAYNTLLAGTDLPADLEHDGHDHDH